jgi:hypothetical protein
VHFPAAALGVAGVPCKSFDATVDGVPILGSEARGIIRVAFLKYFSILDGALRLLVFFFGELEAMVDVVV